MSKVTLISPINSTQHIVLATGEQAGIAHLLRLIPRDLQGLLTVVTPDMRELTTIQFLAHMHGRGRIGNEPETHTQEVDYEYQLAATC